MPELKFKSFEARITMQQNDGNRRIYSFEAKSNSAAENETYTHMLHMAAECTRLYTNKPKFANLYQVDEYGGETFVCTVNFEELSTR